jgi:Ni/Fe-hydrogenase subunit HybB-like protein
MAFGGIGVWWLLDGLRGASPPFSLTFMAVVLALAAAGYSAFLFGQAEGRDFWQSPMVLPHLVAAALVAGCAVLLLAAIGWPGSLPTGVHAFDRRELEWEVLGRLSWGLWLALLLHGALLIIELTSRHPVQDVALAARLLTRGAYRVRFWGGVLLAGSVLPMIVLIAGAALDHLGLIALAALLALAGLWLWEDLWVKVGQSMPLS